MAIEPVRLASRNGLLAIVDGQGRPTAEFLRWLNDTLRSIIYTVNAIAQLPEIQQALADLDAATQAAATAAENAQSAADNAQTAADTTTENTSLANSYPSGATLTAEDAGANTTITISAHIRMYGDGTTANVAAGMVTGLPYSADRYVYYDDPARAGGAVSYAASASAPAQTNGRHVVGRVTTPAALAPVQPGRVVLPPGSAAIQ
jgi:hypothetical protein